MFVTIKKFSNNKLLKILTIILILGTIGLVSYSTNIVFANQRINQGKSSIHINDVPSAILGQYNIKQTSFNTITKTRGFHLGGVHSFQYKNSDLAVYVYDSGNSRILAFLNPDSKKNPEPDKVFGQNDSFLTGACNGNNTLEVKPTPSTLCLNRGVYSISEEEEPRFTQMATDTNGNLYVEDQYNNRVLRFNNPYGTEPGEGDTKADYVWGQADFTSKLCNRGDINPNNNTLCTSNNITASTDQFLGGGVDIDNWGNMWVSDSVNNRVLRFPFDTTTKMPSLIADIVIGQTDMKSIINSYKSCDLLNSLGLCSAYTIKVNKADGELYILHGSLSQNPKYRITVYSPNTTTSNPTSYKFNREFGKGILNIPRSISFIDANTFLMGNVSTGKSDQILRFDRNGTLLNTISDKQIIGSNSYGAIDIRDISGEISINGNYLYVTEQLTNNSLLIFDITNIAQNSIKYVGEILGGTHYTWNTVTEKGLSSPHGLTLSNSSKQIFSSSGYRILVWDMSNGLQTDQPAKFEIGQPDFSSNVAGGSSGFNFYDKVSGLAVDDINHKLWVTRNDEIYAFNLPITVNQPVPSIIFDTRVPSAMNYTGNILVKGQSETLVFRATAIAFDKSNSTLWIADDKNNRVVHITNIYSNPLADLIIGQAEINGTQCNRNDNDKTHPTAQTLCGPGAVALDNFNNLYIAEGMYEGRNDNPGNKRIVEYDKNTIDTGLSSGIFSQPSANRVYGVQGFNVNPLSTIQFQCLENTPCNPVSISFDSQNRMVVLTDAYYNIQNKRIFTYNNPLRNKGYVPFDVNLDNIITLSIGQGGFSSFDQYDNLYIQDHTWNRIIVLLNKNTQPACTSYIYSNWGSCTVQIQGNITPIAGSWDGIGWNIGLYSSTGNNFLLKTSRERLYFSMIDAPNSNNLIPIAGDWTGIGHTGVGLYDPSTKRVYLKNNNVTGPADISFVLQTNSSNKLYPIAGDWNKTGHYGVGLYDSLTGSFYLKNDNINGSYDTYLVFGNPGNYIPLAGDWKGTGNFGVGIYNPSTATFYLKNNNTTGFADNTFVFGYPNKFPLSGIWQNVYRGFTMGVFDNTQDLFVASSWNEMGYGFLSYTFAPDLVKSRSLISSVPLNCIPIVPPILNQICSSTTNNTTFK